ncbi:hypothetical protein ACLESD_22680 [Pyxidicoccus sp. 3LFB2]
MLKSLVLLLSVFLFGATPVMDRPVVDTTGRLSPSGIEAVTVELSRLPQDTGAQTGATLAVAYRVRGRGPTPAESAGFLGLLFGGLAVGGLLGLCVGPGRQRLGTSMLASATLRLRRSLGVLVGGVGGNSATGPGRARLPRGTPRHGPRVA